jgi:hypothetical protein
MRTVRVARQAMAVTWQLTITQLDESMDVGLSVCKISCLPIRVKAEVHLLSDDPLCEAEQGACSNSSTYHRLARDRAGCVG